MDSRIIVLIMALTTYFAYPFLSGSDRKHVAPLPLDLSMEEADDEPEPEDEDEPVMMDDEDDVADLQIGIETESLRKSASDSKIGEERQQIKSSASDAQLSLEDLVEED